MKYADATPPTYCKVAPAGPPAGQRSTGRLRLVRSPLVAVPGMAVYLRVNRPLREIDVLVDGHAIVQAEPHGYDEFSDGRRCVRVPMSLLDEPAHLRALRPGQRARVTVVAGHGATMSKVTIHVRLRHNYDGIPLTSWFAALGCPDEQIYGAGD